MNYFDQFKKLRLVTQGKSDKDYISLCDEVGAVFEMTLDEIGILYSLAVDSIAGKQIAVADVTSLLEKELGEEHRVQAREIAELYIKRITTFTTVNAEAISSGTVVAHTLPSAPVPSRATVVFPNAETPIASAPKNLIPQKQFPTQNIAQNISAPRVPLAPRTPIDTLIPKSAVPVSEKLDDSVIAKLIDIAKGTGYTKEKIETAYARVPMSVKQAVTSVDVAKKLQEIGQKFELHIDQIGSVASEAGLLMVGLTHPNDFISHLENRLRIGREKAALIGKSVNEEIFRIVRDALREIHEERAANETGVTIEKENVPTTVQSREESNIRREDVLRDIETPPSAPLASMNSVVPKPPSPPLQAPTVSLRPQPPANLPIGTPAAQFENRSEQVRAPLPPLPPKLPSFPPRPSVQAEIPQPVAQKHSEPPQVPRPASPSPQTIPIPPRPLQAISQFEKPVLPRDVGTVHVETVGGNLVAEKLSGIVRGTASNITIPPRPPSPQKRYDGDPYREPAN